MMQIGDFGMSRNLEDNNYYITHGGKIPVQVDCPRSKCSIVFKLYGAFTVEPQKRLFLIGDLLAQVEMYTRGHFGLAGIE